MENNIENVFHNLLEMTQNHEDAPDWAMGLKLGEECGEVQTAILKANGFLHHKTLDEDVLHEIADVMNVCCSILTATYPNLQPIDIIDLLAEAMEKKGRKYAKVLGVEDATS